MENMEDKHRRPTQPISLSKDLTGHMQDMPAEEPVEGGELEGEPKPSEPGRWPYDEEAVNQDEIVTPVPIVRPQGEAWAEPRRPRSSPALWAVVGLCLVISLLSLVLNGVLIYNLLSVRQMAREGLDTAINALDNLEGKGFHYEYRFEQTVPFSGDIPFKQDLIFPFKGDFPIKTTVKVPINVGTLGTFVIEVPIDTNVPVDVSVPIHVDQTIHVSTTIPLDLTIPIDVRPDDPAIRDLLGNVREWLVRLRASF